MRRYLWPVTVVAIVAISLGTAEYVKIANERGHLFSQLEDAASIVSENPAESAEALAAMERGTLIAASWPCHWWEDSESVRSETAQRFTNLIALNRERALDFHSASGPNPAGENR